MNKILTTFLVLLWASPAFGSDVWVFGKTFFASPSYYSSTEGTYEINYRERLPWGSRVFVVYGFSGKDSHGSQERRFEWADEVQVEMQASASYTWQVVFDKQLHARSMSRFIEGLSFSFRIEFPDGDVRYDNGGESIWGYYNVDLYPVRAYVPGEAYPGRLEEMEVVTVDRN